MLSDIIYSSLVFYCLQTRTVKMFSQVDAEFGNKLSESLSRYAWNCENSSKLSKDAQNFAQIHFTKTRCTSKCSIYNTLWLESSDIYIIPQTTLSKVHKLLFKLRNKGVAFNIILCVSISLLIWFNNSETTVKLHVSM